jgi:hypothetical protein
MIAVNGKTALDAAHIHQFKEGGSFGVRQLAAALAPSELARGPMRARQPGARACSRAGPSET